MVVAGNSTQTQTLEACRIAVVRASLCQTTQRRVRDEVGVTLDELAVELDARFSLVGCFLTADEVALTRSSTLTLRFV